MKPKPGGISLVFGAFVILAIGPVHSGEPDSKALTLGDPAEFGWTPRAIAGAYTSGEESEGYIDFLAPLWSRDDTLLFLYPRLGLSSNIDPGFSVGLGLRHYFENLDAIIGGNLFYDRYGSPRGNDFNQLGLGAEVLTRRIDFRFNYYFPESDLRVIDSQTVSTHLPTTVNYGAPFPTGHTIQQTVTTTNTSISQLFERYEDSMDGFDTELGVLLPWLDRYAELRLFAGYYQFDSPFGNDLEGMKARAELRLSSKLALDAVWYEDAELAGDNWVFGIRANIPVYMENIADGRSPFQGSFSGLFDGLNLSRNRIVSGSSRPVSHLSSHTSSDPLAGIVAGAADGGVRDRMTEEILRRPQVNIAESGLIEDLSARDTIRVTDSENVVLESGLVFVHNRQGRVRGAGTFEDPAKTIQRGVNRASTLFQDQGKVFVAGTGTNYNEDVVDRGNSVRIWGGGDRQVIKYGDRPVLRGGFHVDRVPAFELHNFNIQGGNSDGPGLGHGVSLAGVREVDIRSNRILKTTDHAIDITIGGRKPGQAIVQDNFIQRTFGDGVFFLTRGGGDTVAQVNRNQVRLAVFDGIHLVAIDNRKLEAVVARNRVNRAGVDGIRFDAANRALIRAVVFRNRVGRTGIDNFSFLAKDQGILRANVVGNFGNRSGFDSFFFDVIDSAVISVAVFGNTSVNAGQDAFDFEADGSGRLRADIVGNLARRSVGDSLDFDFTGSSEASLIIDSNLLGNSGSNGMEFDIEDSARVRAWISGNQINRTGAEGIEIDQDEDGRAAMQIVRNRIVNTADDPLDIDLDNDSTGRYQVALNRFRASVAGDDIDIDTDDTSTLRLQMLRNVSNADFNFDETGGSTFLLEDTLGTNIFNGGAVLDIDASIPPLFPRGTFNFPAP